MELPQKSPDMEAAVNNLHQHLSEIEVNLMSYLDQIATSGFSDKRWCAVARTDLEKGFMAAHRALRDYPGSDQRNYGKVPLDTPLPKEFAPPTDMPDQYGRDRNVAPHDNSSPRQIDWKDYSPGEKLDPPDRPDPE